MADKKEVEPTFTTRMVGQYPLTTRNGRGLVGDDIMPYMMPKPGETKHAKGGTVSKNPFAKGGPSNFGTDYRKGK